MKKILTLLFFVSFTISFAQTSHAAQPVKEQTIKHVTEPTWLFDANISRGGYHDRQDLGFILRKNTPLKIRQSNPNFKEKINVRLLGNDDTIEKEVSVGSDWVTISAPNDLVPFVDSPFGNISAILQYQVDSNQTQKTLPVYQLNGNTQSFFRTWDQQDSEYALIKGKDFQMFAPKIDKPALKSLKDFTSLNDLIGYFDGIFARFDQMIGLDNSSPIHRRPETRYFIKADKNGVGYAYYGKYWTALSKDEIGEMWLAKNTWGTLHEIAHGYQAGFDNNGMYTGEVSNNLFGAQYQYEELGKSTADRIGWLFDYGKKTQIDNDLYNELINKNKGYNEVSDLRLKLLMLALLKQKAGDNAFTELYRNYREMAANGEELFDSSYQKLMHKFYSDHNKLDITPVLDKWKFDLDQIQGELNRVKGYTPIASLADVVPSSQLPAARKLVEGSAMINSNFQMVTNQDIAALGLKGNLTVRLNTDNFEALRNSKAYLKDGKKIVKETTITSNNLTFKDVPNGVYSFEVARSTQNKEYLQEQNYVYIKESNNNLDLNILKNTSSSVTTNKITLAGLSDTTFGTLLTNLDKQQLIFEITSEEPHYYFPNETYVSVEVKDSNGKVIRKINIEGTNESIRKETIDFKEGYTLTVFHEEASERLLAPGNLINKNTQTNTFTLTKQGLKNTTFQHNPEIYLMEKIDQMAALILSNTSLEPFPHSTSKYQLWLAISVLSAPNKEEYLNKYKEIFNQPESSDQDYSFIFNGYADETFAVFNIDTQTLKATLETKTGVPHSYFTESYGTLMIQDKKGTITFEKDYLGHHSYQEQIENPSVKLGDYLTVTHKEFENRLLIFNQEQQLTSEQKMTFQITENGLVKAVQPPTQEPEKEDQVQFTLNGYADKTFATLTADLTKKQAKIEINEGLPHSVFANNFYSYILIKNKADQIKYRQEFIGDVNYSSKQELVALEENDTITIMHLEWETRFLNDSELEKSETSTYKVTKNGLQIVK